MVMAIVRRRIKKEILELQLLRTWPLLAVFTEDVISASYSNV